MSRCLLQYPKVPLSPGPSCTEFFRLGKFFHELIEAVFTLVAITPVDSICCGVKLSQYGHITYIGSGYISVDVLMTHTHYTCNTHTARTTAAATASS